jgi:predicted Zn-dependent protease
MLGVRYMTRAGYSPDGMTSFFKKLRVHRDLEAREQGRNSVSHNIMSTHPRTEDRIRQAIKLAKERTVKNPKVRRAAYLQAIDGLIFGDDPSQGVRRGRSFMHPGLRIAFAVPPGFVMSNSPRQLVAFGPEMSRIIFDMADPKEARRVRSLTDYVGTEWGRHLNERQPVERLEVNGLRGATVQGRVSGQDGARDVRLVVMRGDREKIFRFAFITKPSETQRLSTELRRTTFSFRRLSAKEAADIRPLRVRITAAKRGDTVASLAKRYPFERFQKEWFRLLNNMKLGDKIRPGQKVKMVTG